jgi:hypothetical protein
MKRLLLCPLPDGTLVYRWATAHGGDDGIRSVCADRMPLESAYGMPLESDDGIPSGVEPDTDPLKEPAAVEAQGKTIPAVQTDAWIPIVTNEERDAVIAQACSEGLDGQVLVPPELCHRYPVLPVVLLRRGGRTWLRTLQQVFTGVPLSWSLEGAGERTCSPLTVPLLVRPDAPRPVRLGLLAGLMLAGLLLGSALDARYRRLQVQADTIEEQVTILEQQRTRPPREDPPTTTNLGQTDRVVALEGWASWMTAHLLAATVGTVNIREVRTGWLPPLELGAPRLPEALGWELHLTDTTPRNLQRVASRLTALGLELERIREERSADGAAGLQTVLTGRYPLTTPPTGAPPQE